MNVLLDSESVGLISGLQRTPRYNTHIRVIMLQLLIMLYIIMVPLHPLIKDIDRDQQRTCCVSIETRSIKKNNA